MTPKQHQEAADRLDEHQLHEEDELMMFSCCSAQLMALMFPLIDVFAPLIWFDKEMPKAGAKAIFNYYRSLVQRHLYFHRRVSRHKNHDFVYLSKNPTFTLRLESLYREFPSARVVALVRDPYEAIPSMVSYICKCWHVFAEPLLKYPFASELQGMCSLHYSYPREVKPSPGGALHIGRLVQHDIA